MGLRIILRTDKDISHFRRYLLKLIDYPTIDEILICSGYIQEYLVTRYGLSNYSVLDDDLLDSLVGKKDRIKLITVAGKFEPGSNWDNSYRSFIAKISNNKLNATHYIFKGGNWHAKVVIARQDNRAIAAIIGSSNLTGPAYRAPAPNFNYECDVVIWVENSKVKKYFSDLEDNEGTAFSPIRAILDPEFKQDDEEKRIHILYDLIMNEDDLEQM